MKARLVIREEARPPRSRHDNNSMGSGPPGLVTGAAPNEQPVTWHHAPHVPGVRPSKTVVGLSEGKDWHVHDRWVETQKHFLEALPTPDAPRIMIAILKGAALLIVANAFHRPSVRRPKPPAEQRALPKGDALGNRRLASDHRVALDRVCPDVGGLFGAHDYRRLLREAAKAAGIDEYGASRISDYDHRHSRLTHLGQVSR
jgi:hypothetical protein